MDINNIFSYHAPKKDQPKRYEEIRGAARIFAQILIDNTPASNDQDTALRKLRECVMFANASIAINE